DFADPTSLPRRLGRRYALLRALDRQISLKPQTCPGNATWSTIAKSFCAREVTGAPVLGNFPLGLSFAGSHGFRASWQLDRFAWRQRAVDCSRAGCLHSVKSDDRVFWDLCLGVVGYS